MVSPPPIVRTALFTLAVPGTVVGVVPALLLRNSGSGPFRPAGWGVLGAAMAIAGGVLYVWAVSFFATVGEGTPSPADPPRRLVTTGSYRFTRNPLYVSALLVVLGESILFCAPVLAGYAAVLWGAFTAVVLLMEEPRLQATFGRPYEEYRRAVPRWIGRRRPGGK